MKNLILFIFTMFLGITACNSNQLPNENAAKIAGISQQTGEAETTASAADPQSKASIAEIVNNYLLLKNALAADNPSKAAEAGKALEASFKRFNKANLTAEQKKIFEEVEEVDREHGEHIGANGGNIGHQRGHFALLSKDIYDLVKAFGSDQALYQDFCPMYDDGKGAIWLSETKDIKNPYYGNKMLTCGKMKEEIK